MKSTPNKLLELTKANLNWDIRRQRFLVAFILALIAVRTVNFTEIASHMGGTKRKAVYRKIQRFFQIFKPGLGVLYQSTVIPLCWLVLEKKGNSNQTERIQLLNFLLRVLLISSIKVFIAS